MNSKPLKRILLITTVWVFLFNSCKKEKSTPDTNIVSESGYAYNEAKALAVDIAPTISTGSLPPVVDLSPDMPPVGDQGYTGSCVGWATGYYIKSYQEKMEKKVNYLNSNSNINYNNIISPSYIYNKIIIKPSDCLSGSYIPDALNLLLNEGASSWELFPFNANNCDKIPSQNALSNAGLNKIKAYYRIDFKVQSGYDVAKQYLNAGIPIVMGCHVDNDFNAGIKDANGNFIWKSNFNLLDKRPGHALAIVGYDDNLQAFKVVNSWGSSWANNGFGYIKYDWIDDVIYEAYVLIDSKGSNDQPIIRLVGTNSTDVKVGQSQKFTINIFNDGTKPLNISNIDLTGNNSNVYTFPNGKPNFPLTISSGNKFDLLLEFKPLAVQTYNSVLTVTSNATAGSPSFNLNYNGTNGTTNSAIIRLSNTTCPDVNIGQSSSFSLTVSNDGNTPFTINGITSSNSAFTISNFSSKTVGAYSNEVYSVNFAPTLVQQYSTQLSVQSNATSGNNSISISAAGLKNGVGFSVQPDIGKFTACDYPKSTRDLSSYNNWLYSDYKTNTFKLKVASIDSINGIINFVVKKCDNYNFNFDYTVNIYELNPKYQTSVPYFGFANDPDASFQFYTKFAGHDSKKYIAVITDSSLGGDYYCTNEITITW